MIKLETKLKIQDNTGAKIAQCIKIYNGKFAKIGDIILVSIKKIKMKKNLKILKKNIIKALVIQTVYKKKSIINSFLKFDKNSIILLKENKQPFGTRIFGITPLILRKKKKFKILSLSSNII